MSEAMQTIAQSFRNIKLKKIIGVYQIEFVDFKASGLGDFVRGSFTMMQLIRLLNTYTPANITYDMDFRNHPMGKYLICNKGLEKPPFYSELSNLHIDTLMVKQDEADLGYQHLLREMIRFVNRSGGPTVHGFVCRDDVFEEVTQEERDLIRNRMMPTHEMDAYVTSTLTEMGVKTPFTAFHVRMDDSACFPPKPIDAKVINAVVEAVKAKIGEGEYVLISNSDQVKEALRGIVKMKTTAICHIGQNEKQTEQQTKDTLLDYFILSRASQIHAVSTYHRTGFSLECSKVYSIPYTFTQINQSS
jgi:hypothetical protein